MKTLEQLEAEQAAARGRMVRELEIASAAPVTPDRVQLNGKRPAWLIYKADMALALELFPAFQIVPVVHAVGTFGHICPESLVEERNGFTVKGGPFAAMLEVHTGGQFGPTAQLSWHARVAGEIVRAVVGIEGPGYIGTAPAWAASVEEQRDGRGRLVSRTFRHNSGLAALSDHLAAFADGQSGPMKQYGDHRFLFMADQAGEAPGDEQRHALDQLRLAADMLTTKREG